MNLKDQIRIEWGFDVTQFGFNNIILGRHVLLDKQISHHVKQTDNTHIHTYTHTHMQEMTGDVRDVDRLVRSVTKQ